MHIVYLLLHKNHSQQCAWYSKETVERGVEVNISSQGTLHVHQSKVAQVDHKAAQKAEEDRLKHQNDETNEIFQFMIRHSCLTGNNQDSVHSVILKYSIFLSAPYN